jgi:hypothetical protein
MNTEAALIDREFHEEDDINQSKMKWIFDKLFMYQTYVTYSRQFFFYFGLGGY